MHVHHSTPRRARASRRRLTRLLPALALALVVDAALVALVVGVPVWLVALAVVALAVGGFALEVRAAGDGAPEASAWDASDGRGVLR